MPAAFTLGHHAPAVIAAPAPPEELEELEELEDRKERGGTPVTAGLPSTAPPRKSSVERAGCVDPAMTAAAPACMSELCACPASRSSPALPRELKDVRAGDCAPHWGTGDMADLCCLGVRRYRQVGRIRGFR